MAEGPADRVADGGEPPCERDEEDEHEEEIRELSHVESLVSDVAQVAGVRRRASRRVASAAGTRKPLPACRLHHDAMTETTQRLLAALAIVVVACGPAPAAAEPVAAPSASVEASVSPPPPPASPRAAPTATPTPTVATAIPTREPPALPCTDCWPLSGRPLAGGDAGRRPLVVKLDNGPAGRPQYGITKADIVVETLVEGFVTRLAAIFHSREPERFASVRSGRLSDRSITPMVRGALVYSGSATFADALFLQDARQGRYVNLSGDHLASFYRFASRPGPYNLYTTPEAMRREIARIDPRPVEVPRWEFIADDHAGSAGGMAGAAAMVEIVVPYRADRSQVTYAYDAASRTYARSQNDDGRPVRSTDALDGRPVAVTNVVVIGTEIWEVPEIEDVLGNHSLNMRLTGSGPAVVFRDGLRQEGTWSRPSDQAAFTFRTTAGERILLAPGQTWVHVVPAEWRVTSR